MTLKLLLRILLIAALYLLSVLVWNAEQMLGLGRNFIYSIF